jgi:hypothetical protein
MLDDLETLNTWRNAIAHQKFDPAILGNKTLGLADVRRWRSACKGLARVYDRVMREYIRSVTGVAPWK